MAENKNYAIAVFTAKSANKLIVSGESQAWVLDAARARRVRYLVCVQNPHNSHDCAAGEGQRGHIILIAKIRSVTPAADEPGRYKICFEDYAVPANADKIGDVWQGRRNPVYYTSLEDMGVDAGSLHFQSAAEYRKANGYSAPEAAAALENGAAGAGLTIAQAKQAISAHYGVMPEAVEVVIRG